MDYEILFAFVFATAALAISPGPDNIYVLTQSIANGKKYGLATVAGLISGCLVHTTLLAIGVSAILKANDTAFFMIKSLGAVYLLFLAYTVFKGDARVLLDGDAPKKSLFSLFGQGFIMNVLNPKVTIFFLAFFPGFLFSGSLSTELQFYVLGLLFMLVSAIIFSTIAILSAMISEYILKSNKIGLYLKWLQIIVFVGIAVYLFLSNK